MSTVKLRQKLALFIRFTLNGQQVATDLKQIYQASTVEQAEDFGVSAQSNDALTTFAQKWDGRYPTISQLWLGHWERVIHFFTYPADIRRAICTTNARGTLWVALNRFLQKVLKTKGSFPSDESVLKLLYLALRNIARKWTMPVPNWKAGLCRFAIEFPGRIPE